MKVLICCEESGVVRRAFRARGHEAFSNDIQDARDGSEYHYKGDCVKLLGIFPEKYWDLVILHPDCTKVALCGNRHWAGTVERNEQVNWIFNLFVEACIRSKRVALENPKSVIWPYFKRNGIAVQAIQPYQFGHIEQKQTMLGLYCLPFLEETENVYDIMMAYPIKDRHRVHHMVPGPNRKRDRSETYAGIADAMALQWGNL